VEGRDSTPNRIALHGRTVRPASGGFLRATDGIFEVPKAWTDALGRKDR
jgi:hypothetical protein